MPWAAAIGAAGSIVGGVLGNRAAANQAQIARDFSADQYARRWQITMADMRKAGMNPMLAYSQGVGTSPTGAMAAQGDFGGAAAGDIIAQAGVRSAAKKQAATQANVNTATAKQLNAQTSLTKTQTREASARIDKLHQETASEFQRSILIASQNEFTLAQARQVEKNILKIAADTNLSESQRKQLEVETTKMIKYGVGTWGDLIDTIRKADVTLTNEVLNSAKSLWNALKGKGTPSGRSPLTSGTP